MAEFKDIEDLLVWAFRDQRVEAFAAGFRSAGSGWSSASSLGQVMELGTRVDSPSSGTRFVGARCHEDAAVIYDAVMAFGREAPEAWVELIKHARAGTAPDWHEEGPGTWEVPMDRQGRPKRLYRDPVRQRGDMGEAPPELVGTHPDIVEEARAVYRLWHTALGELVPLVNAEMVHYRASPPGRHPRPWTLAVPVIHKAS